MLTTDASTSRGAEWRRVDLHLHSPGVSSFRAPNGADLTSPSGREAIVDAYVEQLVNSGIELAAITDYNGVREGWFESIRAKAAEHGITVLPGAEISFRAGKYDLHVLAVFKPTDRPAEINAFLQGADRDSSQPLFSADGSHRDISGKQPVEGFLRDLRERFGCLLILPHPDQTNGFYKSFGSEKAAQFLLDVAPDALEHCPNGIIESLITTGLLDRERLDLLAKVEFSDPKRIEEIGTKKINTDQPRTTFLKLSTFDVDGLRLALHDPTTRLALYSKPEANHCRIRSLRVKGAGFLEDLEIDWNDDLNVLIGGRGAGKSAIIETLRYALDIMPSASQTAHESLVKRALGSGGQVDVILERPAGDRSSKRYRVQRVLGEDPQVLDDMNSRVLEVEPEKLLGPAGGPTIFGQREIYALSGSEEDRLRLLDELIGEEARDRHREVGDALERLAANGRRIRELRSKLEKGDEDRSQLKTIDHELEVYEAHGASEKLTEASHLESDGQLLESARNAVEVALGEWERLTAEILSPLEGAERQLHRGESQQKVILEEALSTTQELRQSLKKLIGAGQSLFAEASKDLDDTHARWKEALQPLKKEIDQIKREAHSDHLDPDRLLQLRRERAGLLPAIENLKRVEKQLEEKEVERREILGEIQDLRTKEFQLRRERAVAIADLLKDRVQLSLTFKGQKQQYREKLKDLARGAGLYDTALDDLTKPEATDGIALAKAVNQGEAAVQEQFRLSEAMSAKLVEWFRADEARLHELESLIPEDSLQVSLKVDDEYRSLERLSVGQRATAILLLLFALEGRVLVLDQPEDDLDNRFVYEDVVQILREQKGLGNGHQRRQVITATHNANIPVIGDAELVLPLEAQGDRTRIKCRGSIDDARIREEIKTIMEGGAEAFRLRAEKYGGLENS